MSTRDTIISMFNDVAKNQERTLAPLTDDLRLVECGLDSLGFAIVVAGLDETLGVDPFDSPDWVDFPVALGDFVQLYERALDSQHRGMSQRRSA
jgi:acyl carrier protein